MKRAMSIALAAVMSVGAAAFPAAASEDAKYCYYFPAAHAYADESSKAAAEFAEKQGIDLKIMIGADWEQETEDINMRALVADGYTSILAYPSTDGAAGLFEELQDFGGANIITYGGVVYGTIAQNVRAHVEVPLTLLMMMNDGWTKRADTFFIDTGCVLVTLDNIDSYQDDLNEVTERIISEIPEKYLEKN